MESDSGNKDAKESLKQIPCDNNNIVPTSFTPTLHRERVFSKNRDKIDEI